MHYRTLGRTRLRVSEIGLGAWGMGGGYWRGADDAESLRSLHRAADVGVNFFDTALVYNNGHSERLIRRFREERGGEIIIATKIPPKNNQWPAPAGTRLAEAFPHDHILECTEKSLANLGVECIDLQQFHVWTDDWADLAEWYDAVRELQEQGKVRFIGISVNDHDPGSVLRTAASGKIDVFQVIYNIFDQSPERELFPYCLDKEIGVIARVPFDEGGLTGSITRETVFPRGDFRASYFRGDRPEQVAEHTDRLKPLLGKEAATLPELALRFCLDHAAVSTVIPGMRTVRHVEANCAVSDGRRLSHLLRSELKAHAWERNFYS